MNPIPHRSIGVTGYSTNVIPTRRVRASLHLQVFPEMIDIPDYSEHPSARCLCCQSIHTMCCAQRDHLDTTFYKSGNKYHVQCGYGSGFHMETFTFKSEEAWMLQYRTSTPFVCDRCIARYMLDGILATYSYDMLSRLAQFPDGQDLGKAQMEAYRLHQEW